MKTIGFAIKKGELWYSILEGDKKEHASIIESSKQLYNSDLSEPDLMLNFFNLFNEIIIANKPDSVAYKIHLNSALTQLPYMQQSLGILNYICNINNIPATGRSGAWITAGKSKKINECKNHFDLQNLKAEKLASVLVAWYQFED